MLHVVGLHRAILVDMTYGNIYVKAHMTKSINSI